MKYYTIKGNSNPINLGISINNKLKSFNISLIFIDFMICKLDNKICTQIMLQIPFYKLIGIGIIIE